MSTKIPASIIDANKRILQLKVLATITEEGTADDVADWGVFFGVTGKSVAPVAVGAKIAATRPIIIFPVSKKAKAEAVRARQMIVTPEISCSQLVLRNIKPSKDGWENYQHWYEDQEAWKSDTVLVLEKGAGLEMLSNGSWFETDFEGEKELVWIAEKELKHEKALVFPAPSCHLVTDEGSYTDYVLWLSTSKDAKEGPFIAIAQKNAKVSEVIPAIQWLPKKRKDDVLRSKKDPGGFIKADHWTDNLLFEANEKANNSILIIEVLSDFIDNTFTEKPKFCLILETIEVNSVARNYFNAAYFRNRLIGENDSIFELLGREVSSETSQTLRFFQISRKNNKHIFQRIRFAGQKELIDLWNEKTKLVSQGLGEVSKASPVGIVPALSKFSGESYHVISEWSTANADPGNFTDISFDLANTRFFDGASKESVRMTLPRLRDQRFSPLEKDQKIVLNDAVLDFTISTPSVNDNGTLFQFLLKNYSMGASGIFLRDGALAFSLADKTFDESTAEPPTNQYGRFRITCQLLRAQRPFFLWQWHNKIGYNLAKNPEKYDDEIIISYAIEDFSLPLKKVEAAGQDIAASDKFLAPRTVGSVTEGVGERSEPSLLIPLDPTPEESKYLLTFSESVNVGQNHRIDIRLLEFDPKANSNQSTQIKAIILDANPQLVGLIDARFLQQPGYDDGAWVLARRSPFSIEAGGWEILDDGANTEGFKLILPSQTIGEAYLKNKEEAGEPVEGNPIEYRFGAPAILRLSPERLDRRYVSAPWNLRRIWGQAGDEAPGVPFLQAKFELLYGLTANLNPEKAFIAELGSKLGEVPVPPVNSVSWEPTVLQQEAFKTAWQGYLDFYRAWKSRVAILEPSVEDAFANATFSGNITFKPRIDFEINPLFAKMLAEMAKKLTATQFTELKNATDKLTNSIDDISDFDTITQNRTGVADLLIKFLQPAAAEKIKKASPLKNKGADLKYPIIELGINPLFEEMSKYIANNFPSYNADLFLLIKKLKDDHIIGQTIDVLVTDKTAIVSFLQAKPEYNTVADFKQKTDKLAAIGKVDLLTRVDEQIGDDFFPGHMDDLEKKIKAVHNKEGLAGGFHYGFESTAIYTEFWREAFSKGSSSGEVKDLAFSSVGGWGRQTAKFAADKTVIKSNTTMGRTHFYAVERIGRIGVLWNKAKHVIEYERTVVPSRQFMDLQPAELGRPLVRKVREYIEILEPTRSYPDFPGDAADAPGSILSCTFKSIIIPVLSSWGGDVWGKVPKENKIEPDRIGWQVPLWKPGADPDVYPKPQVVFSLLCPPDAELEALLANLSEPQNLWFYTDTRDEAIGPDNQVIPITANVHAWPAIQNVDFTDLPEPKQHDIEPALGDSPELLQVPMPDVLDILPGFERFTFKVDRTELPASVAGRYYADAAITGRMRTASMMRSSYKSEKEEQTKWPDNSDGQQALNSLLYTDDALLKLSANGFIKLNRKVAAGESATLEKFVEQVFDDIKTVKGKLTPLALTDVQDPKLEHLMQLWIYGTGFLYPTKLLWRESLEAGDGIIIRTLNYYDAQRKSLIDAINTIQQNAATAKELALESLNRFADNITKLRTDAEFTVESAFSSILDILDAAEQSVADTIVEKTDELMAMIDKIDLSLPVDKIRATLQEKIEQVFGSHTNPGLLKEIMEQLFGRLKKIPKWGSKLDAIKGKIITIIDEKRDQLTTVLQENAANGKAYIEKIRRSLQNTITEGRSNMEKDLRLIKTAGKDLVEEYKAIFDRINEKVTGIQVAIQLKTKTIAEEVRKEWDKGSALINTEIEKNLTDLRNAIKGTLVGIISDILYSPPEDSVFKVLQELNAIFAELKNVIELNLTKFFANLDPSFQAAKKELEKWMGTIDSYKRLEDAIKSGDKEAILNASTSFANSINKEYGRLANEVAQKVRDADKLLQAGNEVIQVGQQTLNNFRTVWEEFTAPGMGLNRKTVAMIVKTDWKQVEERLSLTPCISRIKQFGEELEGLGLRLPIAAITDRLLPAKQDWEGLQKSLMSRFDFSNLFSDLGGMRFDKLFPGFKMPEFARDKIRITQGFDKENLMAWVNGEADIKLPGKKKLMSLGPLQVELENGQFTGKMRMDIDIDGKIKKLNTGSLSGTWHVNIAGTGIMIFRDTSILFKDGKLTFDLDPRRMEMPGLLKLLTDATTQLSETGAGGSGPDGKTEVFKIGIVKVKELPAGVRAELNIPPISVGGGTTAISNLSFGGHFELLALDKDLNFKFLLGLGFYLGKKETPFNLTVFILGGGGYITCDLTYAPKEGLAIDFVLSLHASAAIVVAVGWMTGMVIIMVGFEGEYHKVPARSGSAYVTIFVRVIGSADILGLITVFLFLGLQATYKMLGNGGSELIGTGEVRVSIRICRFVTIRVSKSYKKRLAGSGSSSTNRSAAALIEIDVVKQEVINILKSLA